MRDVSAADPLAPAPDRVIIVDWSGRGSPSPARPSRDAIWIGVADRSGGTEVYHRTRAGAEAALAGLLAAGGRALVGFDFPLGYPAGTAARLTGGNDPLALHTLLSDLIRDQPDNANNRFSVAAELNRRLGAPAGPFWGCPPGQETPLLGRFKPRDPVGQGVPEKRLVERLNPPAKSVWQLLGAGSVGSQALLGIPVAHRLARATGAAIWPFHPPAALTLAEVYPSLLAAEVSASGDPIPDRAQVRLLARALWRLGQAGRLAPLFVVPDIAREEGWILGAGHADALRGALWE